uniref:Uncharacterized protein n=1 Tax=Rhabditophanes sp. KR3021 TaxID=114890 RepID=A0AC35U6L1_9BILA
MTDPYQCLRASTIGVAGWSILYCLIQFAILGWQVSYVRGLTWEYENRQIPYTRGLDGFAARFPGLYQLYSETPERRRVNAMFTIVIICLILTFVHLFVSVSLLYGTIKRCPAAIWPWFCSVVPNIMLCTAYAVLWWSGDVFNQQLTMSVAEFIMSIGVNTVAFVIVLFYYLRLTGSLTSSKPAGFRSQQLSRAPSQKTYRRNDPNKHFFADYQLNDGQREPVSKGEVPPWRTQWDPNPPKPFVREFVRESRREAYNRNKSHSPHKQPNRPRSRMQYQCVPHAYNPQEVGQGRSRSHHEIRQPPYTHYQS